MLQLCVLLRFLLCLLRVLFLLAHLISSTVCRSRCFILQQRCARIVEGAEQSLQTPTHEVESKSRETSKTQQGGQYVLTRSMKVVSGLIAG
jgi:hypothetical protein